MRDYYDRLHVGNILVAKRSGKRVMILHPIRADGDTQGFYKAQVIRQDDWPDRRFSNMVQQFYKEAWEVEL